MPNQTFSLSRFSPAIQEMCRLGHPARLQSRTAQPIDYITRFSFTDGDIPALLEIAEWYGRELEMIVGFEGKATEDSGWDAPIHAWSALAQYDPIQVVPKMLNALNHVNWEKGDWLDLSYVLSDLGRRSAEEAQTTGNAALDTIPLFLGALKEKERHSTTRMVLSDAVRSMSHKFPEHDAEYHQILLDDLKELRIGCRDWYTEIVCELAFTENPSPELVVLINKVCREGYAETYRYFCANDGLVENFGFDYENDSELLTLNEKSDEVRDVLRAFQNCENTFPHNAVQKARELRDWIIPNLIEVVRDATAYARFHVQTNDGTVQFAVHLLAEFQAKESLPAIFDSFSLTNDELWDYMYGDGLHEAMPGIMNRLIGDEPEFYDQKLRDPQVPVALQYCLSQSLRFLVARKNISLETYGSWLRDYLEIAIQAKKKELVTILAADILDTANPDYLPIARIAFEKGLVDELMISLEEATEALAESNVPDLNRFPDPKQDFSDTVKELSSWAWFQETTPDSAQSVLNRKIDGEKILNAIQSLKSLQPKPLPPPKNPFPNVGRNDPCPCGSGKKYKVCCLKKS